MSAADLTSEYKKDEAERSLYIYTIDPSRQLDIEAVRAFLNSKLFAAGKAVWLSPCSDERGVHAVLRSADSVHFALRECASIANQNGWVFSTVSIKSISELESRSSCGGGGGGGDGAVEDTKNLDGANCARIVGGVDVRDEVGRKEGIKAGQALVRDIIREACPPSRRADFDALINSNTGVLDEQRLGTIVCGWWDDKAGDGLVGLGGGAWEKWEEVSGGSQRKKLAKQNKKDGKESRFASGTRYDPLGDTVGSSSVCQWMGEEREDVCMDSSSHSMAFNFYANPTFAAFATAAKVASGGSASLSPSFVGGGQKMLSKRQMKRRRERRCRKRREEKKRLEEKERKGGLLQNKGPVSDTAVVETMTRSGASTTARALLRVKEERSSKKRTKRTQRSQMRRVRRRKVREFSSFGKNAVAAHDKSSVAISSASSSLFRGLPSLAELDETVSMILSSLIGFGGALVLLVYLFSKPLVLAASVSAIAIQALFGARLHLLPYLFKISHSVTSAYCTYIHELRPKLQDFADLPIVSSSYLESIDSDIPADWGLIFPDVRVYGSMSDAGVLASKRGEKMAQGGGGLGRDNAPSPAPYRIDGGTQCLGTWIYVPSRSVHPASSLKTCSDRSCVVCPSALAFRRSKEMACPVSSGSPSALCNPHCFVCANAQLLCGFCTPEPYSIFSSPPPQLDKAEGDSSPSTVAMDTDDTSTGTSASSLSCADSNRMQILFKDLSGRTRTIDGVRPSFSIAQIKSLIKLKTSALPKTQRLLFNGKELEDCQSLSFYGIAAGSTVGLELRGAGGNRLYQSLQMSQMRSESELCGPKGGDMMEEFDQFVEVLKAELQCELENTADVLNGSTDSWFYIPRTSKALDAGEVKVASMMALHNQFLGEGASYKQKHEFIERFWSRAEERNVVSYLEEVFDIKQVEKDTNIRRKQYPTRNKGEIGWFINFSQHAGTKDSFDRLKFDVGNKLHRTQGRNRKAVWKRKAWIDRAVRRFAGDGGAPSDDYDDAPSTTLHVLTEESGSSSQGREVSPDGLSSTFAGFDGFIPSDDSDRLVSDDEQSNFDGDLCSLAEETESLRSLLLPLLSRDNAHLLVAEYYNHPSSSSVQQARDSLLMSLLAEELCDSPTSRQAREDLLQHLLQSENGYHAAVAEIARPKHHSGAKSLAYDEERVLANLARRADQEKMRGKPCAIRLRRTRGQKRARKYYRAPPRRLLALERQSVKELARTAHAMAKDAGIEPKKVIIRLAKEVGEKAIFVRKRGKEEWCKASIAFRQRCNIHSGRQYEAMREYQRIDIFDGEFRPYSPLQHQRALLHAQSPPELYHHESIYLDVGTKKKRKIKSAPIFHAKFPLELVSSQMTRICASDNFRSSEGFSYASDDFVFFTFNTDKGGPCTSVMGRHLNESKANQAEKNILFAQTGGNASENHYNLSRLLCKVTEKHREAMGGEVESHPMEEFMQATFDDEVVYTFVTLKSNSSQEKKQVAVAFLMDSINGQDIEPAHRITEDLADFAGIRDQVEVDTSLPQDRKYLDRSSYRMMRVGCASDFRFIYDKASDSIIGIASMKGGDIDTWARFPQCYGGYTVADVRARRQIGLEGSDGKMACTLAGHQGQGSTMPCPTCLWLPKRNNMNDALKKDAPLRWDDYDNEKMYQAGKDLPNVARAEKKYKVEKTKNIARKPLFRIHPNKKHCGLMHGEMGCFSHIEKRLISRLKGIEARINLAGAKGKEVAESLEANLDTLKAKQAELRSNIRNLRNDKETTATNLADCESRAEREKESDGCIKDRTESRIATYRDKARDITTKLKKTEEAVSSLQIKIDAHADNIDAARAYFGRGQSGSKEKSKAGSNNYILINILDEAYAVQGVGLGQYHGGRAIIHRHVVRLLSRWDTVLQWFLTTIRERFPNIFDVDAIEDELFKATECFVELAEIIRIQCKQSKLTLEEIDSLSEHWDGLCTALNNYYPATNPWWKLHNGISHVTPAARYLGFLGNANEQGFESWHAFYNRLLPTLRNIPDSAKRAQTLRQLVAGASNEDIALLKQAVESKRITRSYKGRKGVTLQPTPTLRDQNLANFLEVFNHQHRAITEQDDDHSTCSEDEATLDVDSLSPAQMRFELKRRGKLAPDGVHPQAMREQLKDIIAKELRDDTVLDNDDDDLQAHDATAAPFGVGDSADISPFDETSDGRQDDSIPVPSGPSASVDDATASDRDEYHSEPVQGLLLCTFLETPDVLQGTETETIDVVKCPLCEKFVPRIGLAFHIIVRHDACESLPLSGDGVDEDTDSQCFTDSDIENMDAAELEKMCRDHNLSAEGSADELRGRIICHLFPEIEDEAEDEDEDDDGDAIESILDHRKTRRGTYEFHVSFCSGESFWSALEPVRVDAPDLVRDYLRSSGLSSTEPDFVWAKDGVETDDARSIIIDAERERILRMTCSELRLELTKNGLNTKGKKNVLQERLLADEDEDDSIPEDSVHIPREKRASDRVDGGTEGRRTRQRR